MTQDEIIEMAIKAGLAFDSEEYPEIWQTYMNVGKQEIEAFAKFVAAKEREACAKVVDEFNFGQTPMMIQRAIRARGEQVATNDTSKERVDEIQKQRHEANVQKFLGAPQPEQEPVAWPCLIAEADFSENTVILAMQCTDYKVSAGNHWLSNTPPQRTWEGLSVFEINDLVKSTEYEDYQDLVERTEAKLKEKNT